MRLVALALLAGCAGHVPTPSGAEVPLGATTTADAFALIPREDVNRIAPTLGLSLFEQADGTLVAYNGPMVTPNLDDAREAIAARYATPRDADGNVLPADEASLPPEEATRRALIRMELDLGRVTLLQTDVRGLPAADRAMLQSLRAVGEQVEHLFALQTGAAAFDGEMDGADPPSQTAFYRNQGPWCEQPPASNDPRCGATVGGPPPRVSGLYDPTLQTEGFCDALSADHPEVMRPFVTAQLDADGAVVAVPYSETWPTEMGAVADALDATADLAPADEQALASYLRAAAGAFRTNDWYAADVAWARMTQHNSKWYVRVGPDEVYYDPCGQHGGFHTIIARVSEAGLAYQAMLEPVKQDMEASLATLAGPPYQPREVGFDLPEFIEIAQNYGDSRSGTGGTSGQSLPNWGPVADAGGRTVAMTNIGSDPDSVASNARKLRTVLCEDAMALWPEDPGPQMLSTVLHEAAHNLGPAAEYAVNGQADQAIFGGPLASTMEELKAQTAALYLGDWLADHGVIPREDVLPMHVADIAWSLSHISQGMTDASGKPEAYAQLSAIQMGRLLGTGGLVWHAEQPAADGVTAGCLAIEPAALTAGITSLTEDVFHLKSQGDRAAAEALVAKYVEGDGDGGFAALRDTVTARFAGEPRGTFVYSILDK